MDEFDVFLIEGVSLVGFRYPPGLSQDVDSDFKIVDVSTVNIFELHVPVWTIEPFDAGNLAGLHSSEFQELRATIMIFVFPFADPPIVAEAIDGT